MINAEAIKKELKTQGRRQDWLADQMGYTETQVCKVLNGKVTATDKFLKSACRVLGINFFDI